METKDYVYLGLMAVTAGIFYWHGYLSARAHARKDIAAIFNDRLGLMELPPHDPQPQGTLRGRSLKPGGRARRSGTRIRAVFGIN